MEIMKGIKKTLKWIFYALIIKICLFLSFFIVSLILTHITVSSDAKGPFTKEIYLSDNGIHVDLVIPENEKYIAYGWGSEIFYLNTPTWDDLTFTNVYKALFSEPSSVMHVTTYNQIENSWIKIEVNEKQLSNIKRLINKSFKLDNNGNRIVFDGAGYYHNDEFYKAVGNYSCLKTCNSWTNDLLKQSNIKSSYWTPYSFGVVDKHKN
tara:strand:+ start:1084 stop:1707 length:624 start_codon:yes stop_codon:yes gene_type:complete